MTAWPASIPPTELLEGASLFLDFDGTLVEIARRPQDVRVPAGLGEILRGVAARVGGRLAIISGRPAEEVLAMSGADAIVVGSHGLEFVRPGGERRAPQRPDSLAGVLAAMRDLAGRYPGVLVEDKPLGAALHYRQCPAAEQECLALAERLAGGTGMCLQPGKMMIEVRAGGGDKGSAVRALMREPEMAGTRPVFMGDDLTDEPGFAAARDLGGSGILVGEPRETAARYRLAGVPAALAWLEAASAKPA